MRNKITLWYPQERPAYVFFDEAGNVEEEGAPLSADEVYCDICNAEIVVRPVPVVGDYVLCLDCLNKVEPGWRRQIPRAIQIRWNEQILSFLDDHLDDQGK